MFILNADNIAIAGNLEQLDGGAINAASVTINGGRLSGGGVITTDEFVNSGVVEIGTSGAIGELVIDSPFEQTALGSLEVQIEGLLKAVSYDHLEVDGVATLDGILTVDLGAGFMPSLGAAFEVLSATSIVGEFAVLQADPLPVGTTWDLFYGPQTVSLVVTSTSAFGDYNADGLVDAADYTVWRDLEGQMGVGLAADGNDDGIIDEADYSLWSINFGRQFPAASPSAAIPEPAAAGIALLALAVSGITRRHAA